MKKSLTIPNELFAIALQEQLLGYDYGAKGSTYHIRRDDIEEINQRYGGLAQFIDPIEQIFDRKNLSPVC